MPHAMAAALPAAAAPRSDSTVAANHATELLSRAGGEARPTALALLRLLAPVVPHAHALLAGHRDPTCAAAPPSPEDDVALVIRYTSALAASNPSLAIALLRAVPSSSATTDLRATLARLLIDLGNRLKSASLPIDAAALFTEAVAIAPTLPAAHIASAGASLEVYLDYETAAAHYAAALHHDPTLPEAHTGLAVLHRARGNLPAAIASLRAALALDPDNAAAHSNMAMVLTDTATAAKVTSSPKEVRRMYKEALAHDPTYPEGHYNLAVAYGEVRNYARAKTQYTLAIANRRARYGREYPEAQNNLGVICKAQGNPAGAMRHYAAAIDAIRAGETAAPAGVDIAHQIHNNMAVVLTLQGRVSEARSHLEQAVVLEPRYVEGFNNVGVLAREEGKFREAMEAYDRALSCANAASATNQDVMFPTPTDMAAQNRLHMLNYDLDLYSVHDIFLEHRKWGEAFGERMEWQFHEVVTEAKAHCASKARSGRKRDSSGRQSKIRLGLVSGDFFTHSVSYFAECLFTIDENHSLELFVYSNTPQDDAKTAKLRAYCSVRGRWRDIQGMATDQVARQVMADDIDILVDLAGHTAGNRLDVFALKPAPIQVTWIGYPNTTGLSTIDFRVTDGVVDPPLTTQSFTEKLYRLPDIFLCYTPGNGFPDVAPLPADSNDGVVTFGSFNILAKMRPACIALWARVLRRVPRSTLLLKAKALADPACRHRMESLFYAQGVCPSRLCLIPMTGTTKSHLDLYGRVDIGLDPFPYAGTTTTCEALYMGVPVITLSTQVETEFHAQNVGTTLLSCIGHEELIAKNEEQFVDIALRTASDLGSLRKLRACIRHEFLASPLGDRPRYLKNVETMCRFFMESGSRHCSKDIPETVSS